MDALDLLEDLAAKRRTHIGVIIDEFQEIERLGSEGTGTKHMSAMKAVRAAIQQHRHVTYVFAGSDRRLIDKLSANDNGALHNLARVIEIGPIETQHLAGWLEREFRAMGMNAVGQGAALIAVAGPRTRDVRTLAEAVAELARTNPTITFVADRGGDADHCARSRWQRCLSRYAAASVSSSYALARRVIITARPEETSAQSCPPVRQHPA